MKANVASPAIIARLPVNSSFGADVTFAKTVTERSGYCLNISGAKTLKKLVLSENGADAGTMDGVTVYCRNPPCWKTERARSPLQVATSAESIFLPDAAAKRESTVGPQQLFRNVNACPVCTRRAEGWEAGVAHKK